MLSVILLIHSTYFLNMHIDVMLTKLSNFLIRFNLLIELT